MGNSWRRRISQKEEGERRDASLSKEEAGMEGNQQKRMSMKKLGAHLGGASSRAKDCI